MSESWPADVPDSLWNYRAMEISDFPEMPMMGINFASGFLYAFGSGCLFVLFFAWKRFTGSSEKDKKAYGFKVISEIPVTQLGADSALRRAYLIYAGTLLVIYIAMTFFGKLILEAANTMPMVGVQVDTSSLQFDSPQWPLMLAFGLAGMAPLLPPLEIAEDFLRQRAYRAVGIPVRIEQTTRSLIETLEACARAYSVNKDDQLADHPAKNKHNGDVNNGDNDRGSKTGVEALLRSIKEKMARIHEALADTWIKSELKSRVPRYAEALRTYAELDLLVDWAKGGRGAWPGREISGVVRSTEKTLVEQADKLFASFHKRFNEPYSEQDGRSGLADRREEFLTNTLGQMRDLRDNLTAVLAVYAERDPDYTGVPGRSEGAPIKAEDLRQLLTASRSPTLAGSGPEFGLLIALAPVFLLYAAFSWQGAHSVLFGTGSPGNPQSVLVTAWLETLRICATLWFPLVAAFSLRHYLCEEGQWATHKENWRSRFVEQRLAVYGLALVVAILCLIGLAVLSAFMIAENRGRFSSLLLGGRVPFLLFYPTMALYSLPVVWLAIRAADKRTEGDDEGEHKDGMLAAVLIFAAIIVQQAFWLGIGVCTPRGTYLLDVFSRGCFGYYEGLNLFVYPTLAYLAVSVFGTPGSGGTQSELDATTGR